MDRPDILLFLSDQHHGGLVGYAGGSPVDTPNMDAAAANGTACDNAYTACPVCVPARATLLTGQLPSRTGVLGNGDILGSDRATFLHALAAQGYETVLCGRMHFKGADQRHGFTKRILGDITSSYAESIDAGSVFVRTFGMGGCLEVIGAGESPVLAYDRAVVDAAVDYLQRDHESPQCIVVGTCGPHFPYVAPPDLFERYRNRVAAPASWSAHDPDPNPLADAKRQRTRRSPHTGDEEPVTTDLMLAARAAYCGMIAEQDRLLGRVRDAWRARLERAGRSGTFVYSSDHGDTCGEHGVFGKQTFYEGSARIPLVFEGHGVRAGERIAAPCSIMDIGPTLCELAGAETPPEPDGGSLAPALRAGTGADDGARVAVSEWTQPYDGGLVPGRMVRGGKWKLIRFAHADVPDQLFDLERDPEELENRAADAPEVVSRLGAALEAGWDPEAVARRAREKRPHLRLIQAANHVVRPAEPETDLWRVPAWAARWPETVV